MLLRNHLVQLFVSKQDLVQLLLVPIRFVLHLLLLSPGSGDFTSARIDCRLDTSSLLGEVLLLTAIIEVD